MRTSDEVDLTCGDSLDIDTFAVRELDIWSFFKNFHLDWGDVCAWTFDEERFSSLVIFSFGILEVSLGSDQEVLILIEDPDIIDLAIFNDLTWLKEENLISDLFSSPLIFSILDRVENDAILSYGHHGEFYFLDKLLININDVSVVVLVGDKPLLSILSLLAIHVGKVGGSLDLDGLLVGENVSLEYIEILLIDVEEVGSGLLDKPCLPSDSVDLVSVSEVSLGSHLECLILSDDDRFLNTVHFLFNLGNVGAWTNDKPFVSRESFNLLSVSLVNKR